MANSLLDDMLAAQKQGEPRGVPSICSAHPWVLKAAMRSGAEQLLIESTCNQVNQFGGYTGMTPADFVTYVHDLAREAGFPPDRILLGGDHLGPNVWQAEPEASAMPKAEQLVRDYVAAGYSKIHLDCSMKLGDDPAGPLAVEVSARRAARLARAAEETATQLGREQTLRYVIGTEVPVPGGATEHEEGVTVTSVADVRETIDVTERAFRRAGLDAAWERVVAVVVQPGVEFGDDFVLPYDPDAARKLATFIETQPLVYEAHSTDYQTPEALRALVRDHFAILKVGPGLTFAFREAVFALAMMEKELLPANEQSHIIETLDEIMLVRPAHWRKYYQGDERALAFKRKYSFSDRIRYYWPEPEMQRALSRLLTNLAKRSIPLSLLSQFLPVQFHKVLAGRLTPRPDALIIDKIQDVLRDYSQACHAESIRTNVGSQDYRRTYQSRTRIRKL